MIKEHEAKALFTPSKDRNVNTHHLKHRIT